MHWLNRYITDIDNIRTGGDATELSYRMKVEQMLQAAAKECGADIDILHEPGRTENLGAPDFRISAKGGGVIGYVECKTPEADLHKPKTKAQIEKYRALSDNIMLTDYFRWMHLRGGKVAAEVSLTCKLGKSGRDDMTALLRTFMEADAEKIGDSKRLAAALARRCATLRKGLLMHENNENSRLPGLFAEFRKTLDHDLDYPRFADIFAQTLVYSLLMAKLQTPDGRDLTLFTVREFIPENFAIIQEITTFLPDIKKSVYESIRSIVSDILAIINTMDRAAIADSMSYKEGIGDDDDPYLNFYQTFLAEYDPKLRKSRGVYYTPAPVVKFIVRAADDLLRREFDMPKGLAEKGKVTALDFAAGTGTFIMEMAKLLLAGKDAAGKNILARGHFLNNFYGFELMASAYVISHLKLSRFLADNGIELKDNERIKIYLANTLEKVSGQINLSLMPTLARETEDAQEVKNKPVLVIVGNPPYSGHSQNISEETFMREHKKIKGKQVKDIRHTWIGGLLHGIDDGINVGGSYYEIDGAPLGETNTKWLQDDYVKFIRFAQHKMDMAERGIVAIITNHSFLDNRTFRGMRKSLMDTFDTLYFLDLHGNSKKKEKTPDGGKDENVFDIQQGVAISLMIKNPEAKQKGVFHANMWGLREGEHSKYATCATSGIDDIKWQQLALASPNYYFIPRDTQLEAKYNRFYSVKDIFGLGGVGIATAHDSFVMDFDDSELLRRFKRFQAFENNAAHLHEKFNVAYKKGWDIMRGKKAIADKDDLQRFIQPISYRPFDTRHIFYEDNLVWRTVRKVMNHMLDGKNTGLIVSRHVKAGKTWQHCLVAENIADLTYASNKTSEGCYLFPLYTQDKMGKKTIRTENFNSEFRKWIDERYGKAHTPEDIIGCIYAVLHSPDYRRRYADFLRTDFPRIPFPERNDEFMRLAAIGNALINAHLLRDNCGGEYGELRGDGTSLKVEKVRYDENAARLYFGRDEYFAPLPPEVFNFQIGGYKPLDKYLKSRKGRQLSADEVDTIEKAANAIKFTITKTGEIDQ